MNLKSGFAILDVKRGRVGLRNKLKQGDTVDVLIRGRIIAVWGGDDGTSQEFQVEVDKVEVEE